MKNQCFFRFRGSKLEAKIDQKSKLFDKFVPKRFQDAPRRPQDASKMPQDASKMRFWWIFGSKMEVNWHQNQIKNRYQL